MSQIVKQVIIYVLYFLIIVVIVGAIVIALASRNKTEAPAPNDKGQSTQQTEDKGATLPSTSGNVQVNNQPGTPSGGTTAATGAAGSTVAQTPNGELVDSGPGETAAIFAVGTVMGYMIYRRKLVKQTS